MATKTVKAKRVTKATKKTASDLKYCRVGECYLHSHHIYKGDMLGVQLTTDVKVGDLITLQCFMKHGVKQDCWCFGVYLGLSRGKIKIECGLPDGSARVYVCSLDEYRVEGRIVSVDAFYDAEYIREIPDGTTDRLGIARSDLVM